jgi:hypothetical protein
VQQLRLNSHALSKQILHELFIIYLKVLEPEEYNFPRCFQQRTIERLKLTLFNFEGVVKFDDLEDVSISCCFDLDGVAEGEVGVEEPQLLQLDDSHHNTGYPVEHFSRSAFPEKSNIIRT